MRTTVILLSVLHCFCIGGCKKSTEAHPQVRPPLTVPSITAGIETYPKQFSDLQFEWHYSAEKVIRSGSRTHRIRYWGVGLPNDIPKPTADYTRYLIYKLCLSELGNFGERYDHVSLENYTETVKFILQFEPLELCQDFDEIWSYRLVVVPVHEEATGKYLDLKRVVVSQNGLILYPSSDDTEPQMWGVRQCKRTDRGLLIDIISDHPDEYYGRRAENPPEPFRIISTQYLYRPNAARLEKVTTRTESMDSTGVGYYFKLRGW